MKKLITFLAALVICISTAAAQSRSEQALYGQLITNRVAVSLSVLDRVLKTPEEFSAGVLYAASGVAFREKRLEDAGFLLYVAQLRTRFDNALFPPTGTGGNSPMLALTAYHQELGPVVNPALMREPKVYAKAVARVKSWKPKVTSTYEPGWDYSKKGSETEAEQAVAANRKEFIEHMSGLSTLLLDDTYFSAFKVAQDYNLKPDKEPKRPSKKAYDAAIQTLERIEKEKGIEAVTAVMKN
jgi:hypothetical protein